MARRRRKVEQVHLIVPMEGGYGARVVDLDSLNGDGELIGPFPTVSAAVDGIVDQLGPNGFKVRDDIAGRK